MGKIKHLLAFALCLIMLSSSITAYAKPKLSVIKSGGFTQLSDEDMQDTIVSLVEKISQDCGLPYVPEVSCFDWPEYASVAYNTLITKTICVNLSYFRNSAEADLQGCSVEYLLVKTLAHEVRHSYQWEHQFDDSEYGRACFAHFHSYQEFSGDLGAYNAQFGEADAEAWAIDYANKYFKPKKKVR